MGLRLPFSRFTTIYNGATMAVPDDAAAESDQEPLVLSVGRLERFKGHHRLIEALPHVIRKVPGARLRIVGAGPYEGELQRMAEASGLNGRVQIGSIDPVDRAGMGRALAGASMVALLSEYEANPIAVMEALALEKRVLVADTSGLSELGRRGLAQSIPLESSDEEVAEAIVALLRAPAPTNLSVPTWDESAERLADVYREVLGR
jgi:glycosyltransferase involved in cell wall biosynthesis